MRQRQAVDSNLGDGIIVVSLGCGEDKTPYPDNSDWGVSDWLSPRARTPLLRAMMHGQSTSADYQLNRLRSSHRTTLPYRFDFDLRHPKLGRLDDASEENLDWLVKKADTLARDRDEDLTAIAEALGP